jgi:hypothetical protein
VSRFDSETARGGFSSTIAENGKAKRIGDRETAVKVARAIRERLASGDLQLGPATDRETLATYAAEWSNGLSGLKSSTVRFYTDNVEVLDGAVLHRQFEATRSAGARATADRLDQPCRLSDSGRDAQK